MSDIFPTIATDIWLDVSNTEQIAVVCGQIEDARGSDMTDLVQGKGIGGRAHRYPTYGDAGGGNFVDRFHHSSPPSGIIRPISHGLGHLLPAVTQRATV